MSVQFRVPEGHLLKGPAEPTTANLWRCRALTTPLNDLGPVLFLRDATSAIMSAVGRDDEYFSPGRNPETNRIEFYRVVNRYTDSGSISHIVGLENFLRFIRPFRSRGDIQAFVARVDREQYLTFNQCVSIRPHGQCVSSRNHGNRDREQMEQLLFQSDFFGRPDVYRLFDVRRRGGKWLAFAQERYNYPMKMKVFLGDVGHMVMLDDGAVSYHSASQTFATPLGDIKTNPDQELSVTSDMTMLLTMATTFVDKSDLE